jgi:hypothetical protein
VKNRVLAVFVMLLVVLFAIPTAYAEETAGVNELQLFVSQSNGNDGQSGTAEAPVKSIGKAKEIAKGHKDKKVTILVAQGDYYENISFDEADKRSTEFPLTIKSQPNNQVRLIGAQKVNAESVVPVSDSSVLSRIPEAAQDKVLQVDLKAQGVQEYGEIVPINFGQLSLAPPELFINSSAMTLSRWPNNEYARIEAVAEKTEESFSFTAMDAADRVKRWANAKDVWAYGFWYWDWANAGVSVTKIDPTSGVITAASKEDIRAGQRFYIYNLLEELDTANEFYLDRETGILYFYPTGKIGPNDDILLSLSTEPLLEFKNTGGFAIEGIEVGFTRGNGIFAENSDGLTIENCKIWYTGQLGIQALETNNLTVRGCTITETGAGGVQNTGGDYATLTHSNNLFIDNHIYKFSRIVKSYTPAFRVEGVGSTISHNLIHDEEHIAILYNGNDNTIEYNEIYNVCTSTDDSGAIYTGQRWNDRGNVVRYNYLHDIVGHEGSYGVSGVYLDDVHSSTHVYGNIFYNVARAVLVGGGRDNVVENNMILEAPNSSTASVVIDARGMEAWFQTNLDPETGYVYDHLSKVPWQSEIWTTKYPQLAVMFDNSPKEPRGNIVRNNIIYNHKDMSIPGIVEKHGEIRDNYITDYEDIGFVDYEARDFHLRDDSVIFEILPEFQQIPIDEIGLLTKNTDDMDVSQALLDACARHSEVLVFAVNAGQALVKGERVRVDFNPNVRVISRNGSAYLPIRFLAEQLGYKIEFNEELRAVILTKGEENLILYLNQKQIDKNGESVAVPFLPIMENDRVMIELSCIKSMFPENIFSSSTGAIIVGGDGSEPDKKDISFIRAYLLDEPKQEG